MAITCGYCNHPGVHAVVLYSGAARGQCPDCPKCQAEQQKLGASS